MSRKPARRRRKTEASKYVYKWGQWWLRTQWEAGPKEGKV